MLIGIVGFYLPPDSYIYGQDPEGFFNDAATLLEDFSDCDLLIGSGDLNARIGTELDYLPDIDGDPIPPRTNPDEKKNMNGNHFLTFLIGVRAVSLNGRITPNLNNFTFISPRGRSVPDHMFCPIENLIHCKRMQTIVVREALNKLHIPPPQSPSSLYFKWNLSTFFP